MASTDSPLKHLVETFVTEFASWVLQSNVREARRLHVELPVGTLAVDQVLHVTLADGRALVLHLEFQGCRSRQPMMWRMLDYMARLACAHRLDLWSVVFYVGSGAGVNDTGQAQVNGPDGTPTLSWRYQVIRLWQVPAEELLRRGQPALLALVGQTRMTRPEVMLPQVVARLRQVPDAERRGRLLTALLALLPDEEMVEMVEQLIDSDDLLLDTPFLRRIRTEGREEGREEGRRQGEAEVLVRLLTQRFGTLSAEVHARINAADRETLQVWSARVLSVPTLEALLEA
jgi:predicted transposase YdaD